MESVECLAQWKEGSTYYFLGLISRDHVSPHDYEDRFRCFAYQEIFQVIHKSPMGRARLIDDWCLTLGLEVHKFVIIGERS